jgi:hypothetical protein
MRRKRKTKWELLSEPIAPPRKNPSVQQPTDLAISETGRPKTLDDEKLATVCALVAAGISLRKVARFVACDPQTIRREAQRNDHFRNQLAKAKSEATLHPLETLREAAKTNWRAALAWIERLEPDRYAGRRSPAVTKRDVTKYVSTLIDAIDRIVTNAWEREYLFDILSAAMPAAIRQCWEGVGPRRGLEQLVRDCGNRTNAAVHNRSSHRLSLVHQMGLHLPENLRAKLYDNQDLVKIPESKPDEAGSARQKRLAEAQRHAQHATGDASLE